MMSTMNNIEYTNEPIVKFRWNFTNSNMQSPRFTLGTLGKCFVEMSYSSYSNSTYHLTMSINFTENPLINEINHLKLSVFFNLSQIGYTFYLKKDNASNSKFISKQERVYEPTFGNCSTYPIDVIVYLPKNNSFHDSEFIESMKLLLSDKTYSDLKLIVDDQVFYVHKNILSTRNKFFSSAIEKDWLETKTGEIKLPKWDPMVVKELLCFIYTYTCNVALNTHELFELAHYLDVKQLQILCKNYLLNNINIKNIICTLELAKQSQYELSNLQHAAQKFIALNESQLSKDVDYIEYLSNNIDKRNVTSILRFSNLYQIENLLKKSMEYIIRNYSEILEDNDDCKALLLAQPQLMFKQLIYTLKTSEFLNQENESDE